MEVENVNGPARQPDARRADRAEEARCGDRRRRTGGGLLRAGGIARRDGPPAGSARPGGGEQAARVRGADLHDRGSEGSSRFTGEEGMSLAIEVGLLAYFIAD